MSFFICYEDIVNINFNRVRLKVFYLRGLFVIVRFLYKYKLRGK